MRPVNLNFVENTPQGTEIVAPETPVADTPLTLTSSPFVMTEPHIIELESDGDESGNLFTVTGTLEDGTVVSEVMVGPNADVVASSIAYTTIISIVPSENGADNVEVVVANGAVIVPLDLGARSWEVAVYNAATSGGNIRVQLTGSRILSSLQELAAAYWAPFRNFAPGTFVTIADQTTGAPLPVTAIRLLANGGGFRADVIQGSTP